MADDYCVVCGTPTTNRIWPTKEGVFICPSCNAKLAIHDERILKKLNRRPRRANDN